MQSAVRKGEEQAGSAERFQVETPATRKSSPEGKKLAPFCLICYAAKSQNPRNIPPNVFSDRNGFLWHCYRPECREAIWNMDRDYITGCRVCERFYQADPETRVALNWTAASCGGNV